MICIRSRPGRRATVIPRVISVPTSRTWRGGSRGTSTILGLDTMANNCTDSVSAWCTSAPSAANFATALAAERHSLVAAPDLPIMAAQGGSIGFGHCWAPLAAYQQCRLAVSDIIGGIRIALSLQNNNSQWFPKNVVSAWRAGRSDKTVRAPSRRENRREYLNHQRHPEALNAQLRKIDQNAGTSPATSRSKLTWLACCRSPRTGAGRSRHNHGTFAILLRHPLPDRASKIRKPPPHE